MAKETVQRVAIWSARLRLAHWLMALAVLLLLLSGWLMPLAPSLAVPLRDAHYVAGYTLLLALALRWYLLLFGRAAEQWRDLVPRGPQVRAAWHTLRFYLSLGRAPLPAWYAHNPLWGPLYLLLFAVLSLQALTGLALETGSFAVLRPWWWHSMLAAPIAVLVAAHVVAVFVHDLKGGGADVSAMINGHRLYKTDLDRAPLLGGHAVSLDTLRRSRSKPQK